MNKISIEAILEEWSKDSVIKKDELDNCSINQSKLHSKYLEIWTALKLKVYHKSLELKQTEQMLKRYLSGKMTKEEMDSLSLPYDPWQGESKPLKSEMHSFIQTHDRYTVIAAKLHEYEVMFDAVTEILDKIKWRHQDIRNAIDYMRFTSGF